MKTIILCCATVLATCSLTAAPKDEVTAAAKKLGEQANYSWTSTIAMPADSPFQPGPTEGKADKDGTIYQKSSMMDRTMEAVKKGSKTAFINQDGEWQKFEAGGQGGGRGMMGLRNIQSPADQATNIISGITELKLDGDVYSGDLSEEAAKNAMRMRRGGRGGNGEGGPTISEAKAAAKFWIKDGVLSKFELKTSGKMEFNGNEMNMDRTTTVVIKDVGTTKIELPEGAKKILEATAAN